jgi:chromosome segregation ATPase
MPITKRTARAQSEAPEPKKARIIDPLTDKLEVITRTVADPEFQVPGGESHRELLLASLPHTLTVPCDERHEYQTQMAKMVEVVLHASVAEWEIKVSNAKGQVDLTEQQSTQAMKDLEDSAARVQSQEDEVTKCQEILRVDSEAVKAAQATLEVATQEVVDFDANLQKTVDQKEQYNSVFNECFVHLKTSEGTDQKEAQRLLKRMDPVLKKLGAESSLLCAVGPALKKSSTERGQFDLMAIEGIETVFTQHLAALHEKIDQADVLKTEKVAAQAAAQEALDTAKAKEADSEQGLKQAQEAKDALEAGHQEMYNNMDMTSNMEAITEHGTTEQGLEKVRQALSTFTDLFERKADLPPSADVTMAEAELTAEPSPMETAVAA